MESVDDVRGDLNKGKQRLCQIDCSGAHNRLNKTETFCLLESYEILSE